LSKIMKEPEEDQVQSYDFFAGFLSKREEDESPKEEEGEEEELPEASEPDEYDLMREQILEEAKEQARQILQEAREQAEMLRNEAYEEGKKQGEQEGIRSAYEEHRQILNKELRSFQQNFADVIRDVSIQKDKILEKNVDDLKKISISVAEKVIQTSIRSSEEIVKRMILRATEKLKKRQWAKIYVTKCNTEVNMEVDAEFLESLSHLSDNLKIITMNNGEEGTCIIELPDEVIDASVGTQLENIKDILNNVRV
jgi:flagellar assembly protein FliH